MAFTEFDLKSRVYGRRFSAVKTTEDRPYDSANSVRLRVKPHGPFHEKLHDIGSWAAHIGARVEPTETGMWLRNLGELQSCRIREELDAQGVEYRCTHYCRHSDILLYL